MKPRLSMHLVNFAAEPPGDWQRLFDLAVAADRAGIGRLVVSDHVVYGERLDRYADPTLGGLAGGRQPTGPDGAWLEPLTVLAMVGALTERVRLCPMIMLAALRRPIVLAKTAATIDVLTGGRLDLGVGVGWQREEYEAAGLDFAARGRLLDDTLEVCHVLWTQERASVSTADLSFEGIHQMPKPTAGTVPVWVSGTVNRRSMARLARFGSGWIPWGPDAADIASGIAKMREAVAAAGRDPSGIEVAVNVRLERDDRGEPQITPTMAAVPALVAAGATDLRLHLPTPLGVDRAEEYLAPWVDAFEAAARASG
ncbi:MAG: TIGR03619 family F420-dependent LLM class oxidoreductase [Acidimicrobiaceae bacterium]|nr:TIGR03619 family F420-dependent LLM class oxidoreductase [Acidimicrobiaceae bacterium]